MFNISWYQLLQSFWQRNQAFRICFGGYFKMLFFFMKVLGHSFPSTPSTFFIKSLRTFSWAFDSLPSIHPSAYNNFRSPNILLLCSSSPPETRDKNIWAQFLKKWMSTAILLRQWTNKFSPNKRVHPSRCLAIASTHTSYLSRTPRIY